MLYVQWTEPVITLSEECFHTKLRVTAGKEICLLHCCVIFETNLIWTNKNEGKKCTKSALRAQDWDPAHPNALITYRILLITDAPHAVRTIASLAAFITCRRRIADWRGSFAASLALRGPSLFIVCAKNGTALFLPTGMGRTVRDVLQTVRQEKRCHSSPTSKGISSLEGQSVVPSSSIT